LLFRIRPPGVILARKPLLFNGPVLGEGYTTVLVVCGLGGWIGFRYSMWKVYPKRKLALVLHTVFGAITAYMFIWVVTTYDNRLDNIHHHGNLQWLVIAVLLLLFAVN